jgi:hypothetical protein
MSVPSFDLQQQFLTVEKGMVSIKLKSYPDNMETTKERQSRGCRALVKPCGCDRFRKHIENEGERNSFRRGWDIAGPTQALLSIFCVKARGRSLATKDS